VAIFVKNIRSIHLENSTI